LCAISTSNGKKYPFAVAVIPPAITSTITDAMTAAGAAAPNTDPTGHEMSYHLTQATDRVTAVDEHGTEICGAYHAHDCWHLYITQLVNDTTHLRTPPHHEHFWAVAADHGRVDALAWIELIAVLYILATEHEGPQ
jgi:hypothetical protein